MFYFLMRHPVEIN